tara:strand:- start:1002 stop:1217 length:216 start_codon:yes stop_codon:yes gene_type:complete
LLCFNGVLNFIERFVLLLSFWRAVWRPLENETASGKQEYKSTADRRRLEHFLNRATLNFGQEKLAFAVLLI